MAQVPKFTNIKVFMLFCITSDPCAITFDTIHIFFIFGCDILHWTCEYSSFTLVLSRAVLLIQQDIGELLFTFPKIGFGNLLIWEILWHNLMLWKIVLVLLIQRDIGEMENYSLFLETHPSWKSYDLPFLNMQWNYFRQNSMFVFIAIVKF